MEVRRGSKSSCSETGVLRLAELGGHAPQPSFRMRFVQVTERPSLSRLLFGPMSGKQQGSAFPRHTDNFIQHNLIDRQTMFKTNLKSGNVPCPVHPQPWTPCLPNPFYSGSHSSAPWKWLNRIPLLLPAGNFGGMFVFQTCWTVWKQTACTCASMASVF
jgi:hypothetical protein